MSAVVKACRHHNQHAKSVHLKRMPTHSKGNSYVLGKNHPLELNHEEVRQLHQILHHTLQRLARNGVVPLRPHVGCHALAQDQLAGSLCSSRDAKDDVERLEGVAS